MEAQPVMTNAVPGNTNTSVLGSKVLEDVEPERTYQETALQFTLQLAARQSRLDNSDATSAAAIVVQISVALVKNF
jgi:hypothetical protein